MDQPEGIKVPEELLAACKRCYASMFTDQDEYLVFKPSRRSRRGEG